MKNGILKGVDEIVNAALFDIELINKGIHYRQKTACNKLQWVSLQNFSAADLLEQVYVQIENNWKEERPYKEHPSKENWRFEPKLKIDPQNKSLEIRLQRAIVNIPSRMWPEAKNWTNHVPTASGLWNHKSDKHRAIDLVHVRPAQNRYDDVEFIELKVDTKSGHPVYAAIEVLLYGMLYIFSRRHLEELEYDVTEQPLLQAKTIHLVVLAPYKYYEGDNFYYWLEREITTALAQFIRKPEGYTMDFQFQAFLSGGSLEKTISDEALLIEALKGRKNVEDVRQQWWDEAQRFECEGGGALAVPQSWARKSKPKRA